MTGDDGYGIVTTAIVQPLKETGPWVLFLAVMGFVVTGLMVLLTLGSLFFSLYLYRYAGSIRVLVSTQSSAAMEQALGHPKGSWRLMGIVTIVHLVFLALAVAIGIVVLLLAAAAG